MLGLFFIIFFALYLFISVAAVLYAIKKAKQRGISSWKLGLPVGLVMYLLVFWDHLPTILAHQYYCVNEAGFTIHKSLDQWKDDNPGIAETLTFENTITPKTLGDKIIINLNERFIWGSFRKSVFLSVREQKLQITDIYNNFVLAEFIDFSSGGSFHNLSNYTDSKFWLSNSSCFSDNLIKRQFFDYTEKAKKIGGVNNERE